jgi:hypothetical protein
MAVNAPNSFFTGEGEIVGCDFDQSNGRSPAFAPDFQAFAGDYPQLIFDGPAKYRVVGNHFKPFADPAQGQFAESACIELRGASSCLILGNHFERNPDDTRGDRANRYLLDIGTQSARASNIISDNTVASTDRDDHIAAYLMDRSKSGQSVVSGIVSAVERKVLVVQAEVLSVSIPLTIPMAGPDYKVHVVPQWDAGALWITDKRTDSFTIHWEKSPPKLDQQQEHASGLLDYAVFL